MAVLDRKELEASPLSDLHAIASELGIEGFRLLRREKLIDQILGEKSSGNGDAEEAEERPRPRRPRGGRGRRPQGAGRREEASGRGDEAEADSDSDPDSDGEPDEEAEVRVGVLDILPNGSGFVRPEAFKHS